MMIHAVVILLLLLLVRHNNSSIKLPRNVWRENSKIHHERLVQLLYPPVEGNIIDCYDDKALKIRRNNVVQNPIYNFLHYYYSFSYNDLAKYSVGVLDNTELADVSLLSDSDVINMKYFDFDLNQYNIKKIVDNTQNKLGKTYLNDIHKRYEILSFSNLKPPNLNCFGKHEWVSYKLNIVLSRLSLIYHLFCKF